MTEWINRNTRLPEITEDGCSAPLLYVAHGEVFMGVYSPEQRCWFGLEGVGHDDITEVSHWMPLPSISLENLP